jgi:hypothetical protein
MNPNKKAPAGEIWRALGNSTEPRAR